MMTHLERRVRNLEDRHGRHASGLIPKTPEWMNWWLTYVRGFWAKSEELPKSEKIPFEVARELIQNTPYEFYNVYGREDDFDN